MRITNKMITSKYMRSLNTLSRDLDTLNTRIASGRAFTRPSENTSAAIKAFQIRRDLSKTGSYMANIQHAQSSLTNTESSLMHMEELVQRARDQILAANTGTASTDERTIAATELRSLQNQLLQALNSSASGSYYFGGSNTDYPPFSVDSATGQLMYMYDETNGVLLSSLSPAQQAALEKDTMYVDIGLGLKLDASNKIDPSSVFEYTFSGVSIVGGGMITLKDGTSVSGNLYDLLGTIADRLENAYTYEEVDELLDQYSGGVSKVLSALTEVGAKTSYLKFITDRYDTRTLDLETRQLDVEGADPARTIIDFKSQQVAYNAALQMGTKIIQPSIFDFMS